MRIEIDRLSEAELIDLNNRIVERLRFLRQARAHARMLDFSIGERVWFQPGDGRIVAGLLARYNRKTVTVITENGERWNVVPRLLHRARDAEVDPVKGSVHPARSGNSRSPGVRLESQDGISGS